MPLLSLPEPLQQIAASRVQRPVTAYLIARRDGVTLALASSCRILEWDGWRFQPARTARDSAIEHETGMAAGSLDLSGVLDSSLITETDLDAGRYFDASVHRFLFDAEYPWLGPLSTDYFEIATVERTGNYWTAQTSSLAGKLDRKVGRRYQRTCVYTELGHPTTCGVNLAPFNLFTRAITAVNSSQPRRVCTIDTNTGTGFFADRFTFGKLIVRRGSNKGITRKIAQSSVSPTSVSATCATLFPFPLEVGDVVDLIAGCGRSFLNCRDDFSNSDRFGGDDRMPGPDEILKPATS